MALRRATPEDSDSLWELRTNAIRAIPAEVYEQSLTEIWANKTQFAEFKNVIRDNYYVVYEEDGQILGGGFLDLSGKTIEAMFVMPSWQSKGVGKAILNVLLEEAARLKMDEVRLSSTLNAVSFYKSCGFNVLQPSKYNFDDGRELDCIDMKWSF
jgi:GNAT superfamily N-acetyltransferase